MSAPVALPRYERSDFRCVFPRQNISGVLAMIFTVEEIRRRITPVAVRYRLKAVYLFGSYARGEATDESDVDLLIDTETIPPIGGRA